MAAGHHLPVLHVAIAAGLAAIVVIALLVRAMRSRRRSAKQPGSEQDRGSGA